MFTLVSSVKNKTGFGESADMFDGIDESVLQDKLKETFEGMSSFFKNMEQDTEINPDDAAETEQNKQEENTEFNFDKTTGMPNLDEIHGHLKGLFDGKIGSMAKNIAEEISGDFESILGDDFKNVQSTQDIFQQMMKNPAKMMGLVKKVGDKIKNKMESGEINKDDIMREAGDIMKKMKEMGGDGDKFQEMFKNLAKTMGGKGAKVDMSALDRMTKQQQTRERMRSKLEKKQPNYVLNKSENPNNFVFKLPEEGEQQRSMIKPANNVQLSDEELIKEFETNPPSSNGEPVKKKSSKKKKGGKK
jgi:hypothetical protein